MRLKWMRAALAGSLVSLGIAAAPADAEELAGIVFGEQAVGTPGSPVDGWETIAEGDGILPTIGSTGRDFVTGTNDQALFINPYNTSYVNQSSNFTSGNWQGVVFRPSSPIVVPEGGSVYMVMETFSDVAVRSNDVKFRFSVGQEGDGASFLGFDSITSDTYTQEISFEILDDSRVPGTDTIDRTFRGRTRDADNFGAAASEEYFHDSLWDRLDVNDFGDPVNTPVGGDENNNFLDRSYESSLVFRPQTGGLDMEAQVVDSIGSVTRQDDSFDRRGNPSGNNQNATNLEEIDYLAVAIARHTGFYDGPGGALDDDFQAFGDPIAYSSNAQYANGDPISNPTGYTLTNSAALQMGIKSIRIGVTTAGDLDLDDDVDTLDIGNVISGFTGAGANIEVTWYDGDADNDRDIDTADISLALQNFTGASAASSLVAPAIYAPAGEAQLIYDAVTGEVLVDTNGATLVSFQISGDSLFNGAADFSSLDAAVGFPSAVVDNTSDAVGWVSAAATQLGASGVFSLGQIAPVGLTTAEFFRSFGSTYAELGGGGGSFTVVPEPASGLLVLGAVAGLFATRRRGC